MRVLRLVRKTKHSFLVVVLTFLPSVVLITLYVVGFRFVVVLTDSMEPSIPKYSFVVTAPSVPSVGDVALFRVRFPSNSTFLVLHRVVGATGGCMLTKGDNRVFRDPWCVGVDDVVGVAVIHIPLLGLVVVFAKVLIPLGLLAYLLFKVFTNILGGRYGGR